MPVRDQALWSLAEPAIRDALEKMSRVVAEDKKIDSYDSYPVVEMKEGEIFPAFKTQYHVPDFRKVFGWGSGFQSRPFTYEGIQGFAELVSYVKTQADYASFLGVGRTESSDLLAEMAEFGARGLILEVAARHADARGFEWDEEYALSRYLEVETWWRGGKLPVDIFVPIVNVSFEDDQLQLSDSVSIERITDEQHQARVIGLKPYERDDWLVRAYTHAVVIRNSASVEWPFLMGREQWNVFPYDQVDRVVHAVSILVSEPTGYDQVCFIPDGWSHGYRRTLPMVTHAFSAERYDRQISRGKFSPTETLSSEQGSRVADFYSALEVAHPQVSLAARRLQLASLREDELDEIVDLCVGIEALLGGTTAGDTTYKLGIRGAAVLTRAKYQRSEMVAQLIKKVYAYRSNIVHGQVKYEKKRIVSLDGKQFLATDIAGILLREILAVMLREPDLISKIDNDRVIFELLDSRGPVASEGC
ncbi:HEPN domain-containing protein [Streptomyces sp. DH41]|uniref:HEPN domain-containing protein n=1 Tax=Streptomyces sp. DH41 TaxID=3040125 RepID=UPI002441ED5A|nr:HEPN domain-containing protein [Streptomyces sp. DH41]MDG9721307.1 HEPN domain-containing protein [Streptomyces sp. DH41]